MVLQEFTLPHKTIIRRSFNCKLSTYISGIIFETGKTGIPIVRLIYFILAFKNFSRTIKIFRSYANIYINITLCYEGWYCGTAYMFDFCKWNLLLKMNLFFFEECIRVC